MEDFESKLGQILGNPEMMGRIMSMAQSFGTPEPAPVPPQRPQETGLEPDLATIQKLAGLMGQAGVDSNQKALLCALGPYISGNRIRKLEKAMRAAKLAGVATTFFGSNPIL